MDYRLQGLGRTKRMLDHARGLAAHGRTVCVVAAEEEHAENMRAVLGPAAKRIRVETLQNLLHFDWERLKFSGRRSNWVVLVDHHAIEDRFRKMLGMLHAYDPRPEVTPSNQARHEETVPRGQR